MPPTDGRINSFSHTREGATVTYQCNNRYRPSSVFSSTCTSIASWIPAPEEHNCTNIIGIDQFVMPEQCYCAYFPLVSVSLNQLERNRSRPDIDCPGDTISYNCSIQSNSENVHLEWSISPVFPGDFFIMHDNTSMLYKRDNISMGFTSLLTQYRSDEYIESIIIFTVLTNVTLNFNLTALLCATENFLTFRVSRVIFNTSGITTIATYYYTCRASIEIFPFSSPQTNWIQHHKRILHSDEQHHCYV